MNPAQILESRLQSLDLWEDEKTLRRNEYLKVAGSIDRNLYYIEEGSLRIFMVDGYEEHNIRLGYRQNFIAPLDSFLSGKASELYIQAIKKTKVKVISYEAFMGFVGQSEENRAMWAGLLADIICQQLEREKDILTHSPLERYQRVLERSPQLFQEIPDKHIASYLRMTPETLSRIKNS